MNKFTIKKNKNITIDNNLIKRTVSIIVPVYNVEKYIERCIISLIHQTYRNIEIIFINDGSTDNSKTVCYKFAKLDKRIKVISKQNEGTSASRNLGLKRSKGDYITFVDADDWLEPDAIENMVLLLEEMDVDCVRTTTYRNSLINQKADRLSFKEGKYCKSDIPKILKIFTNGSEQCYVPLLLLKKRLLSKLQPFNEQINMMEDTCFYMDLFTKTDSIYLSRIKTYHYFENKNSITRSSEYYIRNINNILLVNSTIKEMLRLAGLLDDDINKSIDIEHIRLISEYPYMAYINSPEYMKRIINVLHCKKVFHKLTHNNDLSRLSIGHRYTVKYLLSEDDTKLYKLFKLRRSIDQIHNFINRFI